MLDAPVQMAGTGNGHTTDERVEAGVVSELFGERFTSSLQKGDIRLTVFLHLVLEIEDSVTCYLLCMPFLSCPWGRNSEDQEWNRGSLGWILY